MEFKKRLIVNVMDKGGVGKSYATVHIAEYLREYAEELNFRIKDPDLMNSTAKTLLPDCTDVIDATDAFELDSVLSSLADNDIVLMDGMGSQQTNILKTWNFDVNLLESLQAYEARITYIFVVLDDTRETIEQVREGLKLTTGMLEQGDYPDEIIDFLIVRNKVPVRSIVEKNTSSMWMTSQTRAQALKHGAVEIVFEELNDDMQRSIEKNKLTMCQGEAYWRPSDVMAAQRFKQSWARMVDATHSAREVILP